MSGRVQTQSKERKPVFGPTERPEFRIFLHRGLIQPASELSNGLFRVWPIMFVSDISDLQSVTGHELNRGQEEPGG